MIPSKYFKEAEFQRCTPACSLQDMDPGFMITLDKLRARAGIPLVITSAYRPVAYEKKKGRSGNSAHTRGLAVDIRCNSSSNRYKITKAAIDLGIRRIGFGNGFIHVDTDPSLPQEVAWDYYGG